MKRIFKSIILLCALISLSGSAVYAQSKKEKQAAEKIRIYNAVKNGTTYIIVSDLNFLDHEKYIAQLRLRWSITRDIQFNAIHNGKFDIPVYPGDSFFSLNNDVHGARYDSFGYHPQYLFYYNIFWTLTDDFFTKKVKYSPEYVYVINAEDIDYRYFLPAFNDNFDRSLYFSSNGYPGVILNQMQDMANELNADPAVVNSGVILHPAKMTAQDTLYIPDFNFFKETTFSNHQMADEQKNKILKNYSLPYMVLTHAELDKKIILSKTPFYYAVHQGANFSVYNSQTGQREYCVGSSAGNLTPNDLKKLDKTLKAPKAH